MMRVLELKENVWPWIEVRRSRKKIGKSRQNTIGFSDNENDRLLNYSRCRIIAGESRELEDGINRIVVKDEEEQDWK